MPFSYFPDRLSTDITSQIRLLINDRGPAQYYLHDEELLFFYEEEANNVYMAAARACEQIATQFGSQKGKTVGDLSLFSGSDQSANFIRLAATLRRRGMRSAPAVLISTGRDVIDKETDRDDDGMTQPSFGRRQFDNPPGSRDLDDNSLQELDR